MKKFKKALFGCPPRTGVHSIYSTWTPHFPAQIDLTGNELAKSIVIDGFNCIQKKIRKNIRRIFLLGPFC